MSVVPSGHPDPDRKKALQLYGLLGATLVLFLVPHVAAALVSVILLSVLLFISGRMGKNSAAHSLAENHAQYIYRTVWIGSFIGLIMVAFAAIYMVQNMDSSPLQSCSENIINQIDPNNATATILYPLLKPCLDGFIKANLGLLIISSIIGAVLPYLYFVGRLIRGLSRANGGYRISKPKAWF